METKLPPCPFCGGTKLTKMVGGPDSWHCDGCGADSSCWSRRTPGPATAHEKLIDILNDKIEQLVGEIRELQKAGTPAWRERDTMNGLVLANAELRRRLAEHEPARPAPSPNDARRLEDLPPEALKALLDMAEHQHAPPTVASELLPPEILEYLDNQT